MNPSPVIDTAIRPMADNAELQQAAAGLLAKLRQSDDVAETEATRRWNQVDEHPRQRHWKWLLYGILAVVSCAVLIQSATVAIAYRSLYSFITGLGLFGPLPDPEPQWAESLNARQELLLFGNLAEHSKSNRMRYLWDSAPENPVYFAEYARAYLSDQGNLPPDFLATARRIDPDNAWFTYLAAGVEADVSIEKPSFSKSAREAGEAKPFKILDQARVDRAVELLHEAASQPRCNDYHTDLLRQRVAVIPASSPVQQFRAFLYMLTLTSNDVLQIRKLADTISAKGHQLAGEGNSIALQHLVSDTDQFVQKTTHMEVSDLVHGLVFRVCASSCARELGIAASKLGLKDGPRLTEWSRQLDEQKKARDAKPDDDIGRDAGILTGLSIPMVARQVEHPPLLTDADYQPGRLADHDFLSAVSAVAGWLLLLICLGVSFLFRFRTSVVMRRLAARLELLMTAADWAWMVGVGVVFPTTYTLVINRLTPLGGRQHGIKFEGLLLPAAQYLGMIVLIVVLSMIATRWRLRARTKFIAMPRGLRWAEWISALFALAFVPWIGWAASSDRTYFGHYHLLSGWTFEGYHVEFWIACGALAVPLLWLLLAQGCALFGNTARLLHATLLTRTLVPVFATAMLLIVSLVPIFSARAESWFMKDHLINLDRTIPGPPYEYKVAVQLQQETRDLLETSP